jgi:hypothetical protein
LTAGFSLDLEISFWTVFSLSDIGGWDLDFVLFFPDIGFYINQLLMQN